MDPGPVLLRELKEAQTRVITALQPLEEPGEIIRGMPGEENPIEDC